MALQLDINCFYQTCNYILLHSRSPDDVITKYHFIKVLNGSRWKDQLNDYLSGPLVLKQIYLDDMTQLAQPQKMSSFIKEVSEHLVLSKSDKFYQKMHDQVLSLDEIKDRCKDNKSLEKIGLLYGLPVISINELFDRAHKYFNIIHYKSRTEALDKSIASEELRRLLDNLIQIGLQTEDFTQGELFQMFRNFSSLSHVLPISIKKIFKKRDINREYIKENIRIIYSTLNGSLGDYSKTGSYYRLQMEHYFRKINQWLVLVLDFKLYKKLELNIIYPSLKNISVDNLDLIKRQKVGDINCFIINHYIYDTSYYDYKKIKAIIKYNDLESLNNRSRGKLLDHAIKGSFVDLIPILTHGQKIIWHDFYPIIDSYGFGTLEALLDSNIIFERPIYGDYYILRALCKLRILRYDLFIRLVKKINTKN